MNWVLIGGLVVAFTIAALVLWRRGGPEQGARGEAVTGAMAVGPEQVPDEWDFYPARVDDAAAMIRVNFWFQAEAPLERAPQLHWATVEMLDPGEHGMGTDAEAALLWSIEDQIAEEAKKAGLYFVGVLRNHGRWQLTFYGPSDMTERLTQTTADAAGTRKQVVGGKEDADWSYFRDFLLPDAERAAWISDRKLVDQLRSHGDSLKAPRRVDHWVYFATREGRDAFEREMRARGFDVEQKSDTDVLGDPSALQFGVQIHRVDSVMLEDIHRVVVELSDLADANGGDYDGWETQVIRDTE